MNKNRLWTREEEIIVFDLYCKIPFNKSSKTHPKIIEIANIIKRTPSAVNMKIGNFGRFDPVLKNKNISGLTNGSKLDEEIWNEFNNNWSELSYQSELLKKNFINDNKNNETFKLQGKIPKGKEKLVLSKARINQNFYREAILASYNNHCCITGLATPQLLIASHIKPWNKSTDDEKTNPRNGLCLNALHDKAFDKGFITIDTNFKIHVSDNIRDIYDGNIVEKYFNCYENKEIILPEKFLPDKVF
nr:HNH endonuclease [Candidatus Gastranaerophilales bacterium]